MPYECEKCGVIYPDEYIAGWGRTTETDGMGPSPRCMQLIEDENAPPPMLDGGTPNARVAEGQVSQQLCGGQLQRAMDAEPTIRKPTAIKPGRRS